MTPDNLEQFSNLLDMLCTAFDKQASEKLTDVYFAGLSDLTIDAVEYACKRAVHECKFFPKIAELREMCAGSLQDHAEMAWRTFCRLCVDESHYPSLQVYDPALAFAIRQFGGWIEAARRMNEASPEMARAYENQFKTSYKLGLNHADAKPEYFAGFYEAQNRQSLGRTDRAKGREIDLTVCLVRTNEYRRLTMPFDLETGYLTGAAQSALESGGKELQAYLPAPVQPQAQLPPAPSADDEPISEFERRQIMANIKRLAGKKIMPEALPEDVTADVEDTVA